MKTERYNQISRALHWVSAAVIIWASLSGFAITALASDSALRAVIAAFNVSLTTAFIPVFVWRMVHACRAPRPAALSVSRWQQRIARGMHAALYATTTVVLASGVLMMPNDISVFGWVTLPQVVDDPAWQLQFHRLHRLGCTLLGLMVTVHVAAVVAHHRAGRPVLARMRG